MFKAILAVSTITLGFFYTRRELKALLMIINERDYLSWKQLNKVVAAREFAQY